MELKSAGSAKSSSSSSPAPIEGESFGISSVVSSCGIDVGTVPGALLKKEVKTRGEEEFSLQEKLLDKIEFSFQTQELDKVEVMENIDLLDYYLEIGFCIPK